MPEAVFGFVGVIIGVVLTGLYELWRRAIEGQAAARLVRVETVENRVNIQRAITNGPRGERASRSAWDEYRFALTPYLSEIEIMRLAESYSLVDKINERWLPALKTGGRSPLKDWVERLRDDGRVLRGIEDRNPLILSAGLLWRRRTSSQDEIAEAYGATKAEVESLNQNLEKERTQQ